MDTVVRLLQKKSFNNKLKTYRAIIVFQKKNEELLNDKKIYAKYENDFIECCLPYHLLEKFLSKKTYKSINKSQYSKKYSNIIDKFKFNFTDKLNLELAKYYLFKNLDYKKTRNYLDKIIYKKNADWFSCYRAFYLLYLFDSKKRIYWKNLLLSCHPNFPLLMLKKKLISV